jgi:hypothetical protein
MKKTYIAPISTEYVMPSRPLCMNVSDTTVEGDNGSWSRRFGGITEDETDSKGFLWEEK